MWSGLLSEIPRARVLADKNIRYEGKLEYYEDGSIICRFLSKDYCNEAKDNFVYFYKNIEKFLSIKRPVSFIDIITEEEYFTMYKDIFIFRYGMVEVDSKAGDIYFQNKWHENKQELPLINSVIYTGYQNIYKLDPNGRFEILLDNGEKDFVSLYLRGKVSEEAFLKK
jgi:hypothetical protein